MCRHEEARAWDMRRSNRLSQSYSMDQIYLLKLREQTRQTFARVHVHLDICNLKSFVELRLTYANYMQELCPVDLCI